MGQISGFLLPLFLAVFVTVITANQRSGLKLDLENNFNFNETHPGPSRRSTFPQISVHGDTCETECIGEDIELDVYDEYWCEAKFRVGSDVPPYYDDVESKVECSPRAGTDRFGHTCQTDCVWYSTATSRKGGYYWCYFDKANSKWNGCSPY